MNTELALAALEDAKANPDNFDMATFWSGAPFTKDSPDMTVPPCGTTGCFAGFAALRAAPKGTRILPMGPANNSRIIEPGRTETEAPDTEDYAIKALGITEDQADVLFYLQGIEQVERAVHYLIEHPDATWDNMREVIFT